MMPDMCDAASSVAIRTLTDPGGRGGQWCLPIYLPYNFDEDTTSFAPETWPLSIILAALFTLTSILIRDSFA